MYGSYHRYEGRNFSASSDGSTYIYSNFFENGNSTSAIFISPCTMLKGLIWRSTYDGFWKRSI